MEAMPETIRGNGHAPKVPVTYGLTGVAPLVDDLAGQTFQGTIGVGTAPRFLVIGASVVDPRTLHVLDNDDALRLVERSVLSSERQRRSMAATNRLGRALQSQGLGRARDAGVYASSMPAAPFATTTVAEDVAARRDAHVVAQIVDEAVSTPVRDEFEIEEGND